MAEQGVLFDERFLERHAGSIISDPAVAIIELVANAWDAYATKVDIVWPSHDADIQFSIKDNGKGLTPSQFDRRWRVIDYNRTMDEGPRVEAPPTLKDYPPRSPYGRNGRGRHAAFRFGDPYRVRTWRDGVEATYEVRRSSKQPFDIRLLTKRNGVTGHGTEISSSAPVRISMSADEAREIIGTRFLSDPTFSVAINGIKVSFDDIPPSRMHEVEIPVDPFGIATLIVIDTQKADKTTRHHGIAWRVNARLVGAPGWIGFDQERILDGRTNEAKRFIFIVRADYLADRGAVLPDWTGFQPANSVWIETREAIHGKIREFIASVTSGRREEAKESIRENLMPTVSKLSPASRDKWMAFVDQVVDRCPSINTEEAQQVASVLANLELSTSKYGLIRRLHDMNPGDLDDLHQILSDWNVRTAKIALDEIQSRLQLIEELDRKLRDEASDEVRDLQPLFDKSLWVFGPEFESIEFTSNRGMTEVIRKIFGSAETGSRLRPDFVVLPDSSVGFYSRDAYDAAHEVIGVAHLVIAEIKRPGVPIGGEQKDQAWKYVKELIKKGLVTESTRVTCFVLGSLVEQTEAGERKEWDGRVVIRPMAYNVFISRASARMLGLRQKLKDAPFMVDAGIDPESFIKTAAPLQTVMAL
ncbi:ATP-binding protein [Methylobacterium sp. 22177]|uniref:ATP-binding protein n=1 Tax=Methylobacterium sp. 22177 TaxID=3453885 RepID=UPI003F84E3D4